MIAKQQKKEIVRVFFILSFLFFEIFILGNTKYYFWFQIERWLPKSQYPLVWNKLIFLLILIFSCYYVWGKAKKKIEEIEAGFFIALVKGIQAKASSFSAILTTIFMLIHIAWIGDLLMDGSNFDFIKAAIIFFFMVLFTLLNIVFFFKQTSTTTLSKTVLISALPPLKKDDLIQLKKEIANHKRSDIKSTGTNLWKNLDPIRKILLHLKDVKTVHFFCSDIVIKESETIEIWKELLMLFNDIINRKIEYKFNEYQTNSVGFDANDIDIVAIHIEKLMQHIFTDKSIKDKDLAFNITSATSVITSVFTLKSLREGRTAYHIHQQNGEIMVVNLGILTIQELWNELIEKL